MNNNWPRRRWLDFRYGHSIYLIFLLSFSNFVLIFHRLLIERIDWLDGVLSDLWVFVVIFVLIYIPVAILIGTWHRKNQIRVDADVTLMQSPLLRRILKTIIDVQTGNVNKKDVDDLRRLLNDLEKRDMGQK